jgi:cytochrome c biogenesis protein CcmG/thiol:disulfide interchange protein DsbE
MNASGDARPSARRGLWLALAVALSLVAAACGGDDAGSAAGRPPGQRADGVDEAVGDLPSSEVEMADGTVVALRDVLDGRPLVVNFFASWCAPCRAEMPDFATVHGDMDDRVGFLGLAMQDTEDAAAELVELTGIGYPWGLDPSGDIFAELGGFAMPTTVYVTAEGEIASTDSGAISESQLRDRLADLFGVTA